ncbi:NAD(P)-dependent oxidoreductase [Yinghuangia seranimata]|uniref:NAD(P)-dependent oxidoreductase n=1 Tax=Yinghuangia seranimata TaxID=408067 RepID=UPI00248ACF7D|nr:NAD(P)H-binding protein [Yinghuangia seranimata]MDI2126483.1 NAD(P)H-binding protein [Yinghuangia seranimata]
MSENNTRTVVFGAGGKAGRRTVAEAVARGHHVTAVVRDPASHAELAGERVTLVQGDVTDAESVAAVAAGHDAAVNAAARLDVPSTDFYPAATRALIDGLRRAGVARLVAVGIGTVLETAPGVPLHDAPDTPAEVRAFSLGHLAELEILRGESGPDLDWLVVAPPPVFLDAEAERTGTYRIGGTALLPDAETFSYADLAVVLVDEIDNPKHHRVLVAVA